MIALWLLDTDSLGLIPSALLDILDPKEEEHARRLRSADQRRFLLSRIALRRALSEAVGGDPRSWRFATEKTGKVKLQSESRNSSIDFSVSYSDQALAIAVSTSGPVGLDLEISETEKSLPFEDVFPEDQFSENEKSYLRRQSAEARWSEMLKIWTRKEAYSKLVGMGMHLDFSELDMIAWPPIEPELEIETQEVAINERGYFMSLASRSAEKIDIRGSNLFSCDNR